MIDFKKIKYFHWARGSIMEDTKMTISNSLTVAAHSFFQYEFDANKNIISTGDLIKFKHKQYFEVKFKISGEAIEASVKKFVTLTELTWVIFIFHTDDGIFFFDGRSYGFI